MISNRVRADGVGAIVRIFALVAVGLALAFTGPGASRALSQQAPEPRAFLSWNAPYGHPGATDRIVADCGDTTRVDTLYVSFNPGHSRPAINRMEATLYFQPQPGDTLREFWFFKRGWANEYNLWVDFDMLSGFPCDLPWFNMGLGRVSYDHRSGRGRLDLTFEVEPIMATGLTSETDYCVARVRIQHRRSALAGCLDPVCIELASLRLRPVFGPEIDITTGDERLVTWNAGPEACPKRPRLPGQGAWRPPMGENRGPAVITLPGASRDSTDSADTAP